MTGVAVGGSGETWEGKFLGAGAGIPDEAGALGSLCPYLSEPEN